MKNLTTACILFSLLIATPAAAQVIHAVDDPNPESDGCGNHVAAFHANSDAVMVGYHGAWKDWGDRVAQNGGFKNGGCYLEQITRTRPDGSVVWSVSPGDGLGDASFASHKISGLAAMPDGRTVVISREDTLEYDDQHIWVLMYSVSGELQWKTRTSAAPAFAIAYPFVTDSGELFVGYSFSNFSKNGTFKLPDGKTWNVRRSAQRNITTRLSTRNGALEWEVEGDLESVADDQVIATIYRKKLGVPVRARHQILRFDYDGKALGNFTTPEFTSEHVRATTSWNGHVVLLTEKEEIEDGRVAERRSRLHVFDNDGTQKLVKVLSDGARLAESADGAPLVVVAPTNCERDFTYGCVTDELEVVTFKSIGSKPSYSRIGFDGVKFDYGELKTRSTTRGVWVSLKAWDLEGAPGVVAVMSTESSRTKSAPTNLVWSPLKPPKSWATSGPAPLMF